MRYNEHFPNEYVMPPELQELHREFSKLEDVSWGNDTMPHSRMNLHDELYAEIWWDTEEQEDSEWAGMAEWHRFSLHVYDDISIHQEPVLLLRTDDVHELIDAFRHLLIATRYKP